MARVAKIEAKDKKGSRAIVHFDGDVSPIILSTLALEKLRVRVGCDLDDAMQRELIKESAVIEGFDRAVKYIVNRPRTEKEIRFYLLKKARARGGEFEPIEASDSFLDSDIELSEVENEILDKLKEYGYIDDLSFCFVYIDSYRAVKGQKLLRYELERLGVKRELIDEAFNDFSGQLDDVLLLARKWIRGKKEIDYYKLNSFLYSKGFDVDEIKLAIESLKQEQGGRV